MENFVQEQPTRCVNEKAGNYVQNTHFSYPIYPSKSQQNASLCFPPLWKELSVTPVHSLTSAKQKVSRMPKSKNKYKRIY